MNNRIKNIFQRHPLAIYFFLAFTITWLILAPGVASTLGMLDFEYDGTLLTILGGIGPLLAALIVTWANEGNTGIANLVRSMFNWRVKARWWTVAVLLIAGLFAIAVLLGLMMGGSTPDPQAGIYLNGGNIILVALILLLGSFGEEPGWRGFALPRLQDRYSPMKATLILTLFWWLWHIPTYWTLPMAVDAVQQYGFMAAFGIQFVVLLAMGILCAWGFNGSGGSILMPILIHASWNFWSGAFGQESSMLLLPLFLLTSIVVGIATRGRLGYAPASDGTTTLTGEVLN